MKNKILKNGILTFIFLAFTLPAMAQPNDPTDEDDPLPQAPIDHGVMLLLLLGILLGTYLILNYQKINKALTR